MRFRRVGARSFLRLNNEKFSGQMLFGDCGAFPTQKRQFLRLKHPILLNSMETGASRMAAPSTTLFLIST